MLQGIGIDIIETGRFQTLEDKDAFLTTVFTKKEIEHGRNEHDPDMHWAVLFTCKEAILKALALGLSCGSFWHDIVLEPAHTVSVTGHVETLLTPERTINLTHAHSRKYAISCALINT
ncbi:4'-phosphopantetheinyl transferase superfamily protein [candidate division WOR-3 bacterium]|nr:4'-phosphopantetheinyl transferase superfamily protein [candidate division WOR-3 bacterium]